MKIEDQIEYVKTRLDQPVVIIGMMGAGKTTLGRKMAQILNWDFIDSDLEIEREQALSVQEIFATKGEAYFREKEKEKIAELLNRSVCILSVGGGAITNPETAEAIFSKSLCLWVNAPIEILAKRAGSQGTRPLLNGKDAVEVLTERMEQRQHLYNRAHIHVDGSPGIDHVAQNAIGQVYKYLVEKLNEV